MLKLNHKLKCFRNFASTLMVLYLTSVYAHAEPISSERFLISVNSFEAKLPYVSNYPIDVKNEGVERIVIAIHSSKPIAKTYLESVKLAANMIGGEEKTLIVAPQFFEDDQFEGAIPPELLYWDVRPFWGTSKALKGPERISIRISSFEALDFFLSKVLGSGFFPNLRTVVILGHSAGGQMVNRYAASNIFESNTATRLGIGVKYLVMAPSSYLYLSGERAKKDASNKFEIPMSECYSYNDYGYGVDKLYFYHSKNEIDSRMIRAEYGKKNVLYLVGSEDDDPNDSSLSTTCSSMLQGSNRLERASVYYEYLKYYYGHKIMDMHQYKIVPGVGHWGRGLINSEHGLDFIFSEKAVSSSNYNPGLIQSFLAPRC